MLKLNLRYFGHLLRRIVFIEKDPDARKDWGQEEEGMTVDETVGWHHRLDGLEFEQALGVGAGQRSMVCCNPWGRKVRRPYRPCIHIPSCWRLRLQHRFCGDKFSLQHSVLCLPQNPCSSHMQNALTSSQQGPKVLTQHGIWVLGLIWMSSRSGVGEIWRLLVGTLAQQWTCAAGQVVCFQPQWWDRHRTGASILKGDIRQEMWMCHTSSELSKAESLRS